MDLSMPPEGFSVTANTISKPIRYAEVHKALTKSIRTNVKDQLARLPDKIIEKVIKLVLASNCPTVSGNGPTQELLKSHHGLGPGDGDGGYVLNFNDPTDTGERLQDFMEGVYDDLFAHYRTTEHSDPSLRRKVSGSTPWGKSTDDESDAVKKERKEKEAREKEERVERDASEGTERVEGVVCKLLYNRCVVCCCAYEDVLIGIGYSHPSEQTTRDTMKRWHPG
jgi:hypothetical protein